MSAPLSSDDAKLQALRAAAQVGLDAIAAGRYREFKDAASLRAYLEALTEKAIAASSRK